MCLLESGSSYHQPFLVPLPTVFFPPPTWHQLHALRRLIHALHGVPMAFIPHDRRPAFAAAASLMVRGRVTALQPADADSPQGYSAESSEQQLGAKAGARDDKKADGSAGGGRGLSGRDSPRDFAHGLSRLQDQGRSGSTGDPDGIRTPSDTGSSDVTLAPTATIGKEEAQSEAQEAVRHGQS